MIKKLKPDDTTSVFMAGLETVSAVSGATVQEGGQNGPDFIIERERKVAVEIRNEADGRSLVPRLKKLVATTPRADGAATVILRDPRLQISKSAQKTREYLAILGERGIPLVAPTVEPPPLSRHSPDLGGGKVRDLATTALSPDSAVLDWLRSLHATSWRPVESWCRRHDRKEEPWTRSRPTCRPLVDGTSARARGNRGQAPVPC